eukprot:m.1148084 g.1148084  ORF g.1148084 m.1148084 type:complete len:409 (-) comp24473_c0_seq1:3618-4844(-)
MTAFYPEEDTMDMDDFLHDPMFFDHHEDGNYDDIFGDDKHEDIDQDTFEDIQWSDEHADLSDPSFPNSSIELGPSSITVELSQGRLPATLFRWLSPQEIKILLDSVNSESASLSRTVRQCPPSGSIFLFDRSTVKFRKDGYNWEKRADGRTVREDHAKLKVAKLNVIYSCYAHLEGHPSFHRRCYWLLASPRIILVHYLDTGTPIATTQTPAAPAQKLLTKNSKSDMGVSKDVKGKVSKSGSAPARKGSKNSATSAGGSGHRYVSFPCAHSVTRQTLLHCIDVYRMGCFGKVSSARPITLRILSRVGQWCRCKELVCKCTHWKTRGCRWQRHARNATASVTRRVQEKTAFIPARPSARTYTVGSPQSHAVGPMRRTPSNSSAGDSGSQPAHTTAECRVVVASRIHAQF